MLSSSSTPSSARSSDERIDHIIREEVAADHPHNPPAWSFKSASLVSVSASAPSFGEWYGKQLPFWRKVLMALRERRRKPDAGVEYDDPSSMSLLDGKDSHREYRSPSSIFRAARWIGVISLAMLAFILCFL